MRISDWSSYVCSSDLLQRHESADEQHFCRVPVPGDRRRNLATEHLQCEGKCTDSLSRDVEQPADMFGIGFSVHQYGLRGPQRTGLATQQQAGYEAGGIAHLPVLVQRIPDRNIGITNAEWAPSCRSEERRVGKEYVRRVDLGGRRILKK